MPRCAQCDSAVVVHNSNNEPHAVNPNTGEDTLVNLSPKSRRPIRARAALALSSDASEHERIRVLASQTTIPALREALTSLVAGDDVEEALLRLDRARTSSPT